MTFLPIVERELRTAARQRVTHWLRLIAAGLALFIWLLLTTFGKNMTPSQRAEVIFWTISILSLGFAMLAGAFLTADCLSEERREGTLGLLFLTDLKGHDVVLGKLASTSLHAIYGLLAMVPMLAVPLLMGGVTVGEFARAAQVLLMTLFLSLSAGMFVSAISYDSRVAFLRTLMIMVLLAGVMPLLWWAQWVLWRKFPLNFPLWFSPGYALWCAADGHYSARNGAGAFWASLLVIGGLGMTFLIAASALLPRVWHQAREETGGRESTSNRPSNLKRCHRARQLLESKPYFWLLTRDDRMGRWASWIIGSVLVIWFAFFIYGGSIRPGGASFAITILMAFGLHVLFKCMVVAEATRRLSEDRQSGALELLLVTPLRPAEIIWGQHSALVRLFRWPKIMLTVMNSLLLVLMIWPGANSWVGPDRVIFSIMFAGGMLLLFADCFVMAPSAVWCALTTRRHSRAILKTMRTVLLPSWVAMLLLWFFGVTSNGLNSSTVTLLVVSWMTLGFLVDGFVLAAMTARLGRNFRELVATGGSRRASSNPETTA